MSRAMETEAPLTGAEYCVYCGDFFQCRDHVIPIRYNNVSRYFLPGTTVHSCNACNRLLGDVAIFTVEKRADYLMSRYRERHSKTIAFPNWTNEELAEMADRFQRSIRLQQTKKKLILLKLDNLERVTLGLPVEPISPLIVRGNRLTSSYDSGSAEPGITEALRKKRNQALKTAVRSNLNRGLLYRRFEREGMSIGVVDMKAFRKEQGLGLRTIPPSRAQRLAAPTEGWFRDSKGWTLIEEVPAKGLTLDAAVQKAKQLIASATVRY